LVNIGQHWFHENNGRKNKCPLFLQQTVSYEKNIKGFGVKHSRNNDRYPKQLASEKMPTSLKLQFSTPNALTPVVPSLP